MNQIKPWYESVTIQGNIVALLGFIVGVLNQNNSAVSNEEITTAVASVFTLLGIAMSIYGRIKATKIIG